MNRDPKFKFQCLFGLLFTLLFVDCKKDKVSPGDKEEIISPTTGTRMEFTLDSIFLYARQVYLWNEALPSYVVFNPRVKYGVLSPELTAFKRELFDISQLKLNPVSGLPYEQPVNAGSAKYSFMEVGAAQSGIADIGGGLTGNPIEANSILTVGAKKVGYVALSNFPKLSDAKSPLDATFAQFETVNPEDLIIDLRGNGGGYVETAEYVANLIVPAALNNKVMYTEQFNGGMQQGKALILRHQPYLDDNGKPVVYNGRAATMADVDYSEIGNTYKFSKKGNLGTVKNVYFIVSSSTASASELLINCLKPYLNVKLAGAQTYGKPVGFFGVKIDKYAVYLASFLIKNAAGSSDYFNGMNVDIAVQPDGKYPLGDPNEACLSKVLAYIQNGPIVERKNSSVVNLKTNASANTFSRDTLLLGDNMIENRRKLKVR